MCLLKGFRKSFFWNWKRKRIQVYLQGVEIPLLRQSVIKEFFKEKKKKKNLFDFRVNPLELLEQSNQSMLRTSCATTILKWCSTPELTSSVDGMEVGRVQFRRLLLLDSEEIQGPPVEAPLWQVCKLILQKYLQFIHSYVKISRKIDFRTYQFIQPSKLATYQQICLPCKCQVTGLIPAWGRLHQIRFVLRIV